MSAARIFICFACLIAVINSCLIPDKKENQEIHVFHIGSPESKSGSESDIIELHIPDERRKRGTSKDDSDYPLFSCKKDSDCPPDSKCSFKTSHCRKIRK
ncbi:uncharacterized protein [Venturia canescens]|uniref:uncharacterized protein isoform X2 n=1 Tax=Venturia canescens TaxID=32260 RepID=UPI001C9D0790|nr:uncharacterized protein LOC122407189 isoform X2 [Venturia canescens]